MIDWLNIVKSIAVILLAMVMGFLLGVLVFIPEIGMLTWVELICLWTLILILGGIIIALWVSETLRQKNKK